MVELTSLDDEVEMEAVKDMIFRHVELTRSGRATEVLVRGMSGCPIRACHPYDYRRCSRRRAEDGATG